MSTNNFYRPQDPLARLHAEVRHLKRSLLGLAIVVLIGFAAIFLTGCSGDGDESPLPTVDGAARQEPERCIEICVARLAGASLPTDVTQEEMDRCDRIHRCRKTGAR